MIVLLLLHGNATIIGTASSTCSLYHARLTIRLLKLNYKKLTKRPIFADIYLRLRNRNNYFICNRVKHYADKAEN